jgi:hypothetical protein
LKLLALLLAVPLYGADLLDHPAINYSRAAVHDPIARLDASKIKPDLRSVLEALHVPVESQIAVFSKTSLQAPLISPDNPRTIFFNDSVAVGWMKGGFIEIAAVDPRQGVQFYTADPRAPGPVLFDKGRDCLRCRVGEATLDIPGMVVRSTYTTRDGSPMLMALLGVVGIYGVIAYAVSRRTRQIGIRIALGAEPKALQRTFARRGLLLAMIGTIIGLGAAAAATRLMKSLLFGVTALDPITFASVVFVLIGAAALASYLPARRATLVDPIEALRRLKTSILGSAFHLTFKWTGLNSTQRVHLSV